jgi:hypothetical protein
MEHFAGLDVSVKETSVCIVDDTGRIVREVKVASEPEALLQVLANPAYRFKRIGLEAGPLSAECDGVFVHPKLHFGAASKMQPKPCAIITRGEPKRLKLLTLGFFASAVKYLG